MRDSAIPLFTCDWTSILLWLSPNTHESRRHLACIRMNDNFFVIFDGLTRISFLTDKREYTSLWILLCTGDLKGNFLINKE